MEIQNQKTSAPEIFEIWDIFESYIASVIICVLILEALVAVLFFLKMRDAREPTVRHSRRRNGKLSRPLGSLERVLLERERVNHWGTVSSVLLLDSAEKLKHDHLIKALGLLPKRFPLLRMRINQSGSHECFEEMENPETVDFKVLDEIAANEWEKGFEEEINGSSFNTDTGPLWRLRLLKETLHVGKYRNALVFTFHHAICDALSIFKLQQQLLSFLSSMHDGEDFKVESLPLRPPLESLTSSLVKPNIWERLLFKSVFALQRVKNIFVKPKNLYLSFYPPVADSDPSVMKKTCLLGRSLSEEDTKLLIKNCKSNKCTVHGAITASTHLAITRLLQKKKQDLNAPVTVESSYSVSLRKECQPQVSSDDFGAFISASVLSIPVPSVDLTDKQGFWQFARACAREVHTQVDSGKHRNALKFYQCIDIRSYCKMSDYKHNEGRRSHICNINNYGAQSTDLSEEGLFKIAGSYFGVQGAKTSHIFGNNITTVDGKLYWAVEYFPHVTTKTQAEDFTDLTLEILKGASV